MFIEKARRPTDYPVRLLTIMLFVIPVRTPALFLCHMVARPFVTRLHVQSGNREPELDAALMELINNPTQTILEKRIVHAKKTPKNELKPVAREVYLHHDRRRLDGGRTGNLSNP